MQLGRPDIVHTLLRARAAPDAYGYERNDDPVNPDQTISSDFVRPLWKAVDMACKRNPICHLGLASRAIVQLLFCYGAHAEIVGKEAERSPSDRDLDYSA